MKKIIVLFKTHLDVGFTDFSGEIVRKYNEEYIPSAIRVGEEILASGRSEGFVWTTGSWLPWQYLKTASPDAKKRMEAAINNGIIRWHGLPVTLHSEVASEELFDFGLTLSQELDEEFRLHTTGAKYTDVPGHTVAIVPLLAKHGQKLLHIGVNSASTPPEGPDLFIWRAPTGEEIMVMYNKGDYGEFTEVPGTDCAVYFAHTNDNMGPQSSAEIINIYDKLHEKYPEAEIVAGDLTDVADLAETVRDTLPIVTEEIGDTWIHGAGTDPRKMNGYRGLLRAANSWDEADRRTLFESLLLVPEHTWGLDEKTHLKDHRHFSPAEFTRVRGREKFTKMEASWQEQRDYLSAPIAKLSPEHQAEARAILEEYKKPMPELSTYEKVDTATCEIAGWQISFDKTGAVTALSKGEKQFNGELFTFMYEAFSEKEVLEFGDRYITNRYDWALEDFGKIGLEKQFGAYVSAGATMTAAYKKENTLLLTLTVDTDGLPGCPKLLLLELTLNKSSVDFDFAWYDKPASRIPEALWLHVNPQLTLQKVGKLGTLVDPGTVGLKGNREMHCTTGQLLFDGAELTAVDSPLISIEKPFVYGFYNEIPAMDKGIWINLFNNQWGTNFPMWNEGDARFRFTLK